MKITIKNPVRLYQGISSFAKIVRHPERLEEVLKLSESAASPEVLRAMAVEFAKTAEGRQALAEKPRLGHIDLQALAKLPEGTLGRVYADYMISHGLDPADLPNLEANDELSYIRAHLYETHDIWHMVTGFGTDVAGELGLQAFYLAQYPGKFPVLILSGALLNTVFFAFDDYQARMNAITNGWLMGKQSKALFGTRWNEVFDRPLSEIRASFGLAPALKKTA